MFDNCHSVCVSCLKLEGLCLLGEDCACCCWLALSLIVWLGHADGNQAKPLAPCAQLGARMPRCVLLCGVNIGTTTLRDLLSHAAWAHDLGLLRPSEVGSTVEVVIFSLVLHTVPLKLSIAVHVAVSMGGILLHRV